MRAVLMIAKMNVKVRATKVVIVVVKTHAMEVVLADVLNKRMHDKDRPNMKRPISFEDKEWFEKHHDRKKSAIGTALVDYGVVCYYVNHGIENSRFYGDFVLVFKDNTLADYSAANIEQIASSLS